MILYDARRPRRTGKREGRRGGDALRGERGGTDDEGNSQKGLRFQLFRARSEIKYRIELLFPARRCHLNIRPTVLYLIYPRPLFFTVSSFRYRIRIARAILDGNGGSVYLLLPRF